MVSPFAEDNVGRHNKCSLRKGCTIFFDILLKFIPSHSLVCGDEYLVMCDS